MYRISEDETISVRAAEKTFTLRKLPLASKCGYIRKQIVEGLEDGEKERDEPSAKVYEMGEVPGGLRGLELAVRFCCDESSVVVDVDNVALLRCVGEFLEMEEEYSEGNLIRRAEEYLSDVVLESLEDSITVLRHSERLLPTSDRVGLVGRCIDAIAKFSGNDRRFYSLPPSRGYGGDADGGGRRTPSRWRDKPEEKEEEKLFAGWWAEDLTVLRIDTFKRVVLAMKSEGLKHRALGTFLMLYAQKSLRGLDKLGKGRKKMDPKQEHEKRVVLETIVSMLPKEKNALSVSFLAMLLRAAVFLETTVACRLGLEKRMGMQLGQAVLDDLFLPPSFSFSGDTTFDVDSVGRILVNYLEHSEACRATNVGYDAAADDDDPTHSDLERVGGLMESYLAEIATDQNLTVAKFVAIAELIPEQARVIEDGMYRAIDIYLKAHPSISEAERKKVCSVMDCQRLSREACAHAAQNGRLPIQIVVQVMYHEQQRLSDARGDGGALEEGRGRGSPSPYLNATPERELGRLRRENNDLRSQLGKMKSRISQVEGSAKKSSATPDRKAPLPPLPPTRERTPNATRSIIDSVSKKLGRLNPFQHFEYRRSASGKDRPKQAKSRRHSIS